MRSYEKGENYVRSIRSYRKAFLYQRIYKGKINERRTGYDPACRPAVSHRMALRNANRGEHNAFYEAPTIIMLSAEDDFRWSQVDAGIAVQSMALAAESLGLGSLIVGSVYDAMRGGKRDYLKEKMQIPAEKDFQIALAVGHKATEKEPHTYDAAKQVAIV